MEGLVKWFNTEKGYGFIKYKCKDIYVQYTEILSSGFKNLVEGEVVEFELVQTPNGLRAKNVSSKKVTL